jgi:hypothetical protein
MAINQLNSIIENQFELKTVHSILINKIIPKGFKLEKLDNLESIFNTNQDEFDENKSFSNLSQKVKY